MLLSRRKLPLNALRAFEAMGRRGHMRLAAEDLGVTHGALSRQIRLLEEQLQTALFSRQGNRLKLTPAGKRLLSAVSNGLDIITQGAALLDPDTLSGSLTIACTPSIASTWLGGVIGRFSRQYPEIEMHLLLIEPRQQNLPRDFDVALCYGQPLIEDYQAELLYEMRFAPVVSPRLLDDERNILRPEDLLDYPLLHDRLDHWPKWLQQAGIGGATPARNLYLIEAHLAINAARQGIGAALCDEIEVARELNSGVLIKPLEQTIAADYPVYLLTQQASAHTLRAALFVEALKAFIEARISR